MMLSSSHAAPAKEVSKKPGPHSRIKSPLSQSKMKRLREKSRSIKVPISKGPQAARVPKGMERCTKTPLVAAGRTFTQGETVRYAVSLDGLGVGTVDYKVENHGRLNNQDVTEYRSVFQLDSLLSAFVPVAGRAASIVPVGQLTPVRAMNDYHVGSKTLAEEMLFGPDAGRINVTRKVNEKTKIDKRWIHFSPIDFVSGFYYLRSLPSDFEGCTSLYGNGRIYTIWVTKAGVEEIKTPVGKRQADKYEVIYSSDKG
ncbi:DUF3108 domain-containing protein, partial [Myxococcota bacterium]|nr:DUF3108 domain-containing protein [Myxococcota bacterium]